MKGKKQEIEELAKQLEQIIGKTDSDRIVSLNQKYSAYSKRFEKEMNKILNPLGLILKVGVVLKHKGE